MCRMHHHHHRHHFSLLFLLIILTGVHIPIVVEAGLTTKTTAKAPVAAAATTTIKATEKPKNPIKTIAKAKIMGDPLTEQEWLNLVLGQLSPR